MCLVLGLVAGRSDEIGMAVLIILVAVVGSLVAGIWAGIQFAAVSLPAVAPTRSLPQASHWAASWCRGCSRLAVVLPD